MNSPLSPRSPEQLVRSAFQLLKPEQNDFAVEGVNRLLTIARTIQASDLHLIPEADASQLRVLFRIDGVLHAGGVVPQRASHLIARLKVLAGLLTYRSDIPQEGRVRTGDADVEMRLSTFPTVHGEKGVVRFFVGSGSFRRLEDLGFPADIQGAVQNLLQQTSGLFLVSGPAGSGKTTTLYAALRFLQESSPTLRSLCSLEDPVEALLPGVSQTQLRSEGELTYQRGLASLMRQDPEVILVGEIRDRETAEIVFQASLTGHLVLSSFHAGRAAVAVSRLSDMGIEPYILRSGLLAILSQQLLRRCCSCGHIPEGCPACRHTGYQGRLLLCELLSPELNNLGRSILNRDDADRIEELAVSAGMIPLSERGRQAVVSGLTTSQELIRVFGPQIGSLPENG